MKNFETASIVDKISVSIKMNVSVARFQLVSLEKCNGGVIHMRLPNERDEVSNGIVLLVVIRY